MTIAEVDTIEAVDDTTVQAAMFDADEIQRMSRIYLPGFEALGALTGQPVFSDDEVVDAAFEFYRQRGFPYRELAPHVCMQQVNTLAKLPDENLLGTVVGYQVADTYHKHRMHAAATGKRSPIDSFTSDKYLKMAIQKTLKYGAVGEEFLGIMSVVAGTQACSNFRPGFALSYYRRYCKRGNEVVLDTSTGYGGRLVAFLASNTFGTYVGIDPNVPTHQANVRMMRDIGTPKGYRAALINLPAEDVNPDVLSHWEWVGNPPLPMTLREYCDFAFTSPPYFAKERYSSDDTQSWVRYGDDPEHWRDGFLRPMLRLQFECLKADAFSCINVADVVVGKMTAPLAEWTIEAAKMAGFEHIATDQYRLNRRFGRGEGNGEVAYEPVFVFRKPAASVGIVVATQNGHVVDAEELHMVVASLQIADDTICENVDCLHKYIKHDSDEGGDLSCLAKGCGCERFVAPEPPEPTVTPETEPYSGKLHKFKDDPDNPGLCARCDLPQANKNAHEPVAVEVAQPLPTLSSAELAAEQRERERELSPDVTPEPHSYRPADTLGSACTVCWSDQNAPWHVAVDAGVVVPPEETADEYAIAADGGPVPAVSAVNVACERAGCEHPVSEHPEHRGCTVQGCRCKKFIGMEDNGNLHDGAQVMRELEDQLLADSELAEVAESTTLGLPVSAPQRPEPEQTRLVDAAPKSSTASTGMMPPRADAEGFSQYVPAPHHPARVAVSEASTDPEMHGRTLRFACEWCGAPPGYWCKKD